MSRAEDALPPQHPMFTMPRTTTQLPVPVHSHLYSLHKAPGRSQAGSQCLGPASGRRSTEVSSSGQAREARWRLFCKAGTQITDSEQQATRCSYRERGAHALRGWYPASGENFFTRIPRINRARWGQGREVMAKGLWSLPSMELGAGETPRSDCSLGARLPGSKYQVLHFTEETPGKFLNFSFLSSPLLGSRDDSTPL